MRESLDSAIEDSASSTLDENADENYELLLNTIATSLDRIAAQARRIGMNRAPFTGRVKSAGPLPGSLVIGRGG